MTPQKKFKMFSILKAICKILFIGFAAVAMICLFAMVGETSEQIPYSQEVLSRLIIFGCSLGSAGICIGLHSLSILCSNKIDKLIADANAL